MSIQQQNDPYLNQKLVSILDDLIQQGHWDKSLFLKATGKKIIEMRDKFGKELDFPEAHNEAQEKENKEKENMLPEGKTIVYVALYQADGQKLANWENAMESLLARSISRPIYNEEAKAKDMLIKKGLGSNNAYIAIMINKDDIIPVPEKIITDKYGHELVTLKEETLKPENICYFVHASGIYSFVKNHLIKRNESH